MKATRCLPRTVLVAILVIPALALLVTVPARAAELVTEVVPAGHRPMGELLSVLRPLVPAPGSVSGFQGQLVIRTTPRNLAEIKRVLARIDTAPRTLMVSVRRGDALDVTGHRHQGAVRLGDGELSAAAGRAPGEPRGLRLGAGGDGARARLGLSQRERALRERGVQRLRVMEGSEAFIETGERIPFPERQVIVDRDGTLVHDTVRFRDATRGFYVRPEVRGQRVLLEIAPHSARLDETTGNIDVRSAHTTVSGRLGEWIPLGGAGETRHRHEGGVLEGARESERRRHQLYIRVDEVGR